MNNNEKEFFIADGEWAQKYPKAKAGILVIKNINNLHNLKLTETAKEIEDKLHKDFTGYSREDINNIPTIQAYNNYYKNFSKTYHVRSQVESILNGKTLVSSSAVVTAMFMAEVKNMLLTAGHDLDTLDLPIQIKIATGQENFIDIRGAEKKTMERDMIMMDGSGVISSIILGPDSRTKLTGGVKNVLFAVYAPAEVEKGMAVSHLKDIESYIKIFSPDSKTEFLEVFETTD